MGKGKGAKVRLYSYIKRNTPLAALTRLRPGLIKRLQRFVSIRLGRPVRVLNPLFLTPEWAQRHRVQTAFLRTRATEVKALLTFIRRPAVKLFFNKLFRIAWRRPRLRWRSKWPLLPRIALKLKIRRKTWGSGIKAAAPVWAGLASLLAGVRRLRRTKKKNHSRRPTKVLRVLRLYFRFVRFRCLRAGKALRRGALTKGSRTLARLVYTKKVKIGITRRSTHGTQIAGFTTSTAALQRG